jgi:phosphatidylinositol-3-phosphatase
MPERRGLGLLCAAGILPLATVPIVLAAQAASGSVALDTVTISASADATVNSAQPDTNHGGSNWVTADGDPVRYGFYRFDVTLPDGAAVTHADFRCLPGSSNDAGASVWTASGTWDEQTITWNNAPLPDTTGSPAGTTGPVTRGLWAAADVTGAVPGSGSYTLVTSTDSRTAWSCASRENNRDEAAQLVLTTSVPTPEPSTSSPAPSTTTPAPSTTTPAPTSGAHKMLVIPLENHSQSEALSQMPDLAGWAQTYGQATSYFAITHPSLPNYLAIFGGSTFGVTSDCSVGGSGCVPDAPSVWGQTLAAGGTARAYQESMSTNCQTGGSGNYAPRHGPWPYWTDSTERSACQADDVPSGSPASGRLHDDILAGNLPITGELTPNLCNDSHDCSLSTANTWLAGWIPAILAGPDFLAGRLTVIITFDEDDSSQGNKVAFVAIDPRLHGVTVTGTYNHYSLTRWLDDNAGVARLRNAATAPDLRAAFGL